MRAPKAPPLSIDCMICGAKMELTAAEPRAHRDVYTSRCPSAHLQELAIATTAPRRSEDIAGEIVDRAYDADETPTEGTKRFIDRQLDIERRPRAPSVLRDADIVRKKLV